MKSNSAANRGTAPISSRSPDADDDHLLGDRGLAHAISDLHLRASSERRVGDAVAVYCRWLSGAPEVADSTKVAYTRDVLDFADFMEDAGRALLVDVETTDIDLWKHSMSAHEGSTIRRKLTALSEFFRWAVQMRLVGSNPVAQVKRPKKQRKIPPYVTPAHYEMLDGVCRTPQERAVLGCMCLAGCRRQEVIDLRISNLDLEGGWLKVVGKGGHEREVPVCERLDGLLRSHLQARGLAPVDALLFVDASGKQLPQRVINRVFTRWCAQSGLTAYGYTPHAARHGFATVLEGAGFTMSEIMKVMGHQDPKTALQYIHGNRRTLQEKMAACNVFSSNQTPAGVQAGTEEPRDALRDEIADLRSEISSLSSALRGALRLGEQPT